MLNPSTALPKVHVFVCLFFLFFFLDFATRCLQNSESFSSLNLVSCLNLDVGLCPVVLSNWQPLLWNGFGLGRKIRQGPYVSRPINRRCIQRTPVWFHQAVIYPSNRKQLSVYDLMCKPHTPSAALGLGENYQSRLSWHPSNVNPDAETHRCCSCYLDMQIIKKFCPSKKRRGWYYL